MQTVSMIINAVLVIVGVIAFLWNMIGIPAGTVWLVIHLVQKGHKLNKKKWFWVTFGGMLVLIVVFTLYALIFMASALFGINLINLDIPK